MSIFLSMIIWAVLAIAVVKAIDKRDTKVELDDTWNY